MNSAGIKIVNAVSMGGSINSAGVRISQDFAYTIGAYWTGTPTGTLKLQFSTDNVNTVPSNADPAVNVVNWYDYTGSSQSLTGSAGNFGFIVTDASYFWVRLVYTRISGTGTLSADINIKGP